MTGAHPKDIQSAMRHSTISLTMDSYGHALPGQAANAAAALHALMASEHVASSEVEKATGTDWRPIGALRLAQQSERESVQYDASQCDDSTDAVMQKKTPKSLHDADLGEGSADAAGCESAPRRTRTFNPLIKSRGQLVRQGTASAKQGTFAFRELHIAPNLSDSARRSE